MTSFNKPTLQMGNGAWINPIASRKVIWRTDLTYWELLRQWWRNFSTFQSSSNDELPVVREGEAIFRSAGCTHYHLLCKPLSPWPSQEWAIGSCGFTQ